MIPEAGGAAPAREAAREGTGPAALAWTVVDDPVLSGAANMARDHALTTLAAPGRGTVRFYGWEAPTLSFGRNEPVTIGYRELLRNRSELDVVRRPTGGRAVIHDRELTYSVVIPRGALGGVKESYRTINRALVEGLRTLGVDAVQANGGPYRLVGGPCFMGPVEGEVVVEGRKLVGSAQARIGPGVLQHGSLLLVADQSALLVGSEPLADCADDPRARPRALRPVTLLEVMGELPTRERLVEGIGVGFSRVLGGSWKAGAMTDEALALARGLEGHYGSRQWTWRR